MDNSEMHTNTNDEELGNKLSFQRARTEGQIALRQKEIINACAVLYEKGGFDAVNFKAISDMTSFTRQSIYKYYATREEVLLDLLKREQDEWEVAMEEALVFYTSLSKEDYAMLLTGLFAGHGTMLQLIALLFNVLEVHCRIEKLAEFRSGSIDVYHLLLKSIKQYFPNARPKDMETITATVFALAVGSYPMNHMSEKQLEAEKMANDFRVYPEDFNRATFFETSFYNSVLMLLRGI